MITKVEIEPATLATLHKLPVSTIKKVLGWTADVNDLGIANVQKIPAYQDANVPGEPGRRTCARHRAARACRRPCSRRWIKRCL